MPCAALPRGGRVSLTLPASPPASFTPVHALTHIPAFNDAIDNNPCGKPTLLTANGVTVSGANLCIAHWAMVNGLADLRAPNAANGATAGAPGSFTPAGATAPATAADLIAGRPITVTPSPATAWTTGQRVVCTDGSTAYWNGTLWVAGTAP